MTDDVHTALNFLLTGIAPERRQELEEMFEKYSPRF
jgi:hypothetical protein